MVLNSSIGLTLFMIFAFSIVIIAEAYVLYKGFRKLRKLISGLNFPKTKSGHYN